MKQLFFVLVCIALMSCSKKYPYERQVKSYYLDNEKVEIQIVDLKLDTTVTSEQSKRHYEQGLIEEKKSDLEYIRKAYLEAIKTRDDNLKLYGNILLDSDNKAIREKKEKLDNAEKGIFDPNDLLIKYLIQDIEDAPQYDQLSLRYKYESSGAVRVQMFISKIVKNDTALMPKSITLKKYLE